MHESISLLLSSNYVLPEKTYPFNIIRITYVMTDICGIVPIRRTEVYITLIK